MTRPLPCSSSDPAGSMDRKRPQSSKPRTAPGEVGRLTVALAEARAKIAELELMAEVDPLLNILNRRGFERALTRTLDYVKRYRAPAALLYLDLDGFKLINDDPWACRRRCRPEGRGEHSCPQCPRLGCRGAAGRRRIRPAAVQPRRNPSHGESERPWNASFRRQGLPGPARGFPSGPPWASPRSTPMTSPRASSLGPTVSCICARRSGARNQPAPSGKARTQRRAV